jgi:magnesium transporter
MIRALIYQPGKPLEVNLPFETLAPPPPDADVLLWIDFGGESPEVCEPILKSFGFHPLAIDDALQESHTPKVDDWGDYLYLVLNHFILLNHNASGWETEIEELDVFLGKNYIVTHHDMPMHFLDQVWDSCLRDERHLHSGADHLLYKLVDRLVSDYMPFVEQIDQALDEIEDQVFSRPSPSTLERLFGLKRTLLSMRRVILPLREVLNKLARDDYATIDPRDRVFFRDIYDHLVRLHDLNESMRDLVGGALDTYLSVINNRMNEVMKTLTIITTLFMPLSFIAGFFGMNFFLPQVPVYEWMTRPVFYAVLSLIVISPLLMFIWMRRRTWI